MNTKIYQLYHDKKHGILKVTPMHSVFYNCYIDKMLDKNNPDFVAYYNEQYFFSFSRKVLVQKAREMKEEWIKEVKVKLEMYKSIKI